MSSTAEPDARILAGYRGGATIPDLCLTEDVAPQVVRRVLVAAGITPDDGRRTRLPLPLLTGYGISNTLPPICRLSSKRCASAFQRAGMFRRYEALVPGSTHSSTSLARHTRSSRLAA